MDGKLIRIFRLSKALNEITEEANRRIEALERELSETNPGVQVQFSDSGLVIGWGSAGEQRWCLYAGASPDAVHPARECSRLVRIRVAKVLDKLVDAIERQLREDLRSIGWKEPPQEREPEGEVSRA